MSAVLSQENAKLLDRALMSDEWGFSSEQLMELAGLSCAHILFRDFGVCDKRALILVGPGNNGGDALVVARHLTHFGVPVALYWPKRRDDRDAHLRRLAQQCRALDIELHKQWHDIVGSRDEHDADDWASRFAFVVDGFFGFSFDASGGVREPFAGVIKQINATQLPVYAIDVPSGWHVDDGDVNGDGLRCDTLISLSCAKQCSLQHAGAHHLGGRFVPPKLAQQFGLTLPAFAGAATFCTLAQAGKRAV